MADGSVGCELRQMELVDLSQLRFLAAQRWGGNSPTDDRMFSEENGEQPLTVQELEAVSEASFKCRGTHASCQKSQISTS